MKSSNEQSRAAAGLLSTNTVNLPLDLSASIPPTIAETGIPMSAGDIGPGPSSGSLDNAKQRNPSRSESAETEKRKLEREERARILNGASGTQTDLIENGDCAYGGNPPPYNEM